MQSPKDRSRRRMAIGLGALLALGASGATAQSRVPWRKRHARRERVKELFEFRFGEDDPDFTEPDRFEETEWTEADEQQFEERVRAAEAAGEIRPLSEVRAKVEDFGGELLDVELIETHRGWVYGLRVITPRGRRRDIFIYADRLVLVGGPRDDSF